jgi:hypothetical protein
LIKHTPSNLIYKQLFTFYVHSITDESSQYCRPNIFLLIESKKFKVAYI